MRTECIKCKAPLEQAEVGRPRIYCSTACRRAGEYELRRLQRAIEAAEREVALYRRQVEHPELSFGGSPNYKRKQLAASEEDLEALEARLRLVLSDDAVRGEPR